ncbi:MAG: redox-sensing transcriptional repressor Rex [Oscillospiraceae bacterium]|nr:redox-sensing transcriptional repressor Rex [Oscillospiraceae bacterium]
MKRSALSKAVLKRLPSYLSYLQSLPEDGPSHISATCIANALGMGEVQVRKDLAVVSNAGKPKIGYPRLELIETISRYLCYDNTNDAILVGAGKLGQALLGYSGFEAYGLNILAAFDVQPAKGQDKPILPMEDMEKFCRENNVHVGIITVPKEHAQQVCDRLIQCGIRAIWNFAPTHLDVPKNTLVQNENMATSLAVLSMHLQAQMKIKE